MDVVEKGRLISHAEAEVLLRRSGCSQQQIEDVLSHLPDPIDTERDGEALFERGISTSRLMDWMGASP